MPTTPVREKCWNCRRRRLRCDAQRPHCQKCIKNGVECLGYGQVLKWVGGMATRGNLTDEKFREMRERGNGIRTLDMSGEDATGSHRSALVMPSTELTKSVDHAEDLVLYRPLVEPVFQDMSYNERFFVAYCKLRPMHAYSTIDSGTESVSDEHRLCPSLGLWHSDKSPYKSIIQLFSSSPAILTTALAAAVCHYANSTMEQPLVTFAEENSEYTYNASASSLTIPITAASRPLLETYYTLKQKSLRLLAQAMSDPKSRADMSTLVTTMLLLVLEFLETGFKTWSIHLEGAKKLLEVVNMSGQLDVANELDGIADGVIEYDRSGLSLALHS